ncbi:SagB/ThcOx family dehydrogenase [Candidatus Hodarchaeum mangrovi]
MTFLYKDIIKLKFGLVIIIFVGSIFVIGIQLFPLPSNDFVLPSPKFSGNISLKSAIYQSKISSNLTSTILPLDEIGQLLWALQGITHGPSFRTVPSAGATYPLTIYLIQRLASQLKTGLYSYNPFNHALQPYNPLYNESFLISLLNDKDRETIFRVNTVFIILADYSRTTDRYGYRGIQYVHLEVGHALQNFLLQLVSLELNTWVISNFTSKYMKHSLDTTLEPLLILPVGRMNTSNMILPKIECLKSCNENDLSVEEAIAKRKSTRDYIQGEIPLVTLTDLLYDSTTINFLGGSQKQIDIRCAIGSVEGLSTGQYYYYLQNNSLIQYSSENVQQELKIAALNQQWVETAQLDLILSINTTWINDQINTSYYNKLFMYNIGMIAQNIYLNCAALKLGTVVIGAFYESEVNLCLNLSNSFTPIYIIPVGLTPEFFMESTPFITPLTELARNIGYISFIFFYFTLYSSLPIVRKRLLKKERWIHCILGFIPFFGLIFHFMTIHGYIKSLWEILVFESYLNAFNRIIKDLTTLPVTRYDLGLYLAYLTLFFGILAVIIGIAIAFKLFMKPKTLKLFHKWILFIALTSVNLHILFNGTVFTIKPLLFLFLNILALDFFYVGKLYNEWMVIAKKKVIS